MGNPFLFADRFSGAVVHLTARPERSPFKGASQVVFLTLQQQQTLKTKNARDSWN
jgi:hypothetical protein